MHSEKVLRVPNDALVKNVSFAAGNLEWRLPKVHCKKNNAKTKNIRVCRLVAEGVLIYYLGSHVAFRTERPRNRNPNSA
jgi:hypothetical protein